MQDSPIPAYVDTRKVFQQLGEVRGSVALDRLPRFREGLATDRGTVRVELRFSVNESNQRLIGGSLRADVDVTCQRCLEPMALELADEIRLALLADERAAADLDGDLDPWICADYRLDLASLVEEQLMLCMPIVSLHQDRACLDQLSFGDEAAAATGEPPPAQEQNPFAVLKTLKE